MADNEAWSEDVEKFDEVSWEVDGEVNLEIASLVVVELAKTNEFAVMGSTVGVGVA